MTIQTQSNGASPEEGLVALGAAGDDDYFSELTDHGIEEDSPDGVDSLLEKDIVLGNVSKNQANAVRHLVRNQKEFIKAMYPPKASMIQGTLRAAYLGSHDQRMEALTAEEMTNMRTAEIVHELRTSRSVDGFQQKRMGEHRQVTETEDNASKDSNDTGFFGGLFG